MPTTLPLDVYEALEEELGKERARRLVHALEKAVDAAVESKWLQVRDELLARLVTKEEFRSGLENLRLELVARIEQVHAELSARMDGLSARIEQVRSELGARIEQVHAELSARMDGLSARIEQVYTELSARIDRVHAELSARIDQVRSELGARIEQVYTELSARIDRVQTSLEAKIERLNLKMNFVLLLLILLATLWSPPVAELLRKLLGLG